MENKRAVVASRIVACVGMAVGIISLIFGIVILNAYVNPSYYKFVDSSIKFGADYYTDSYEAMAASANNSGEIGLLVMRFVEIFKECFGYLLIVIGLIVMACFVLKFIKTYNKSCKRNVSADESQKIDS